MQYFARTFVSRQQVYPLVLFFLDQSKRTLLVYLGNQNNTDPPQKVPEISSITPR